MAYQYMTSRKLLKDAAEKSMNALGVAENYLRSNNGDAAESWTELGEAYARVAQAASDSMDEGQ